MKHSPWRRTIGSVRFRGVKVIGAHTGTSLQLLGMWKAFDGSLLTTVCRSSLAGKILCNNKCEGRWWEAGGGGVLFSPFLSYFWFSSWQSCLLQGLLFTRWLRKATEPGVRKNMKTSMCVFPPVVSHPRLCAMLVLYAQCQEKRDAYQSSVIIGTLWGSCFHPSWIA